MQIICVLEIEKVFVKFRCALFGNIRSGGLSVMVLTIDNTFVAFGTMDFLQPTPKYYYNYRLSTNIFQRIWILFYLIFQKIELLGVLLKFQNIARYMIIF